MKGHSDGGGILKLTLAHDSRGRPQTDEMVDRGRRCAKDAVLGRLRV